MTEVLVTGGTGVLGSAVVPELRGAGHGVRVLSRTPGEGRIVGDLRTGDGVAAAVAGVDAVVHAASAPGRDAWATDVEGTRRLAVAARDAGVGHLVHVSIPGVDRIPYSYYHAKFAAEQVLAAAGVPYTVLRVSQFHPLVAALLGAVRRGPLLPVPAGWRLEPVAVRDVAAHLARRLAEPAGDGIEHFGGPEAVEVADLARTMLDVRGRRGYVLPVALPGGLSRAVRGGANLVPAGAARGALTWEQWLTAPEAAGEVEAYARRAPGRRPRT